MRRITRHFLFWLVYLFYQAYIEFSWISNSFKSISIWERFLIALEVEAILIVLKLPVVYASFYIIKQFAVNNRKYVTAISGMFILVILTTLCHRYITVYLLLPYIYLVKEPESVFIVNRLISSFIDVVFILGIANAVKQYSSQLKMKDYEKNLVKEKLEAELQLLKNQTNPHFLFNTLNNIYALARKNSDKTADVVMKLSKLLRFMLYESSKKTIPITQEIKLIEDYLELERIRYNERLNLSFTHETDNSFTEITPLLLLPLVENAFKHGASESRFNTSININLSLQNNQLDFTIINNKEDTGDYEIVENIGLKSIRRQLQLIYTSYTFEIKDEKTNFKVHLKIDLSSYVEL